MSTTDGHSLKRAILYTRVSTDEQARTGYSLTQQLEALREYAVREDYEILEEISDPGQSGASLERPGMDRVRDLVASGGVSVVLAQDRDRFSREPAYTYLLRREFQEHGCALRSLNDRGDGSPEGELTDGILDQLAKFERAKTAERTRRGRLRRAREGKIIPNNTPDFGFTFNEARDNYVVNPQTVEVVRRIFYMVGVEGRGLAGVKKVLDREQVPTPGRSRYWSRMFLRRLILDDAYKPHTFKEVSEIVTPEVAARLDPETTYGIWYYGRNRITERRVAEHGPDGTIYRRKTKSVPRPQNEWIGVPIPDAGIPPEWVEAAREEIKDNHRTSRAGSKFWELSGCVARCGVCGARMMPTGETRRGSYRGYYYRCATRWQDGKDACSNSKTMNARNAEPIVWEFVSGILKNPGRLREGLEEMIEQKKQVTRRDPEVEVRAWLEKLSEVDRKRSAYQDQQAENLITLDELRSKLSALEEARTAAQSELDTLRGYQEEIEQLEYDADALLEHYARRIPGDFDALTSEQRNNVYKMMRLQVWSYPDGSLEADWAFDRGLRVYDTKHGSRPRCST